MATRNKKLTHVEAQKLSGVFDTDYYRERKVDVMPKRESAIAWEQRLRDEEREQKRGRTKAAREQLEETDADPVMHASRFGQLSGANVVEVDVGEGAVTASKDYEVEITQTQIDEMQRQGIDTSHLKAGNKVNIKKSAWS